MQLTKKSGLKLNADKTELLRLKKTVEPLNANDYIAVNYMNKRFELGPTEKMKINGIFFR